MSKSKGAFGRAAAYCMSMLYHASGGFTAAVPAFNVEEFPGLLFCADNKPLDPLKNTCYPRVFVNATVVVLCSDGILNFAGSRCGIHPEHWFLSERQLFLRRETARRRL